MKSSCLPNPGKTLESLSYRPPIELSCSLCAEYASSKEALCSPILLADVGAARGFDPRWKVFGEKLICVGFEPEPEEYARLLELNLSNPRNFVLPLALSDVPGKRTLNIVRHRDASSFYAPYMPFYNRLPDPSPNEIVGEVEVMASTFDQIELPGDLSCDVLKLDVQGAELDVLRGAQRRLSTEIVAVVVEVVFQRVYHEQPMFRDIDGYLSEQGFKLFDLDIRRCL